MIRVQCPHCQRRYRTEMEAFGRTAVCTRCSQAFKIGESRPPFQWKNTDLAEDSWIGVPEPEEKKEMMKHCIICDAPLRPEMVRCPECGANQVTGVVHKSRRHADAEEHSVWSVIPVRLIRILLAIAVVGGGIYWAAKTLGRRGVELGDEMADTAMAGRVARELERGEDEADLAGQYAGYVKDANVGRFAGMLAAENANWRRAAILLIGGGQQTQIEPVVAAARSTDAKIAAPALAALEAIGHRRLIDLSNHQDEKVRRTAIEALCLLFELDPQDARLAPLTRVMPVAQKIQSLNEVCRPWPELVGAFIVLIDDTPSPVAAQIEQIGKSFHLRIGREEFVTQRGTRKFTIPLHRWCMATGSAVDGKSVRELMGGSVSIASAVGATWDGEVSVTGRRRVTGPLPGFLPLETPGPGQTVQARVRLVRSA